MVKPGFVTKTKLLRNKLFFSVSFVKLFAALALVLFQESIFSKLFEFDFIDRT